MLPISGRRAFLGNPPYVRHHDLSSAAKIWAKRAAAGLGLGISGLAGLHALFILKAASSSKEGDLGCFVTSAEWLDVGYGRLIRDLLSTRLGCARMDLIDPRAQVFEDAMSTGLITGWQVGYRGPVTLRRASSRDELKALNNGLSRRRVAFDPNSKWSPLFSRRRNGSSNGLVPLSTIARVHRGVVTGANAFFLLRSEDSARLGLESYIRPCLHCAH